LTVNEIELLSDIHKNWTWSHELKKIINHKEVWNSVIFKRLMQAHIGQN